MNSTKKFLTIILLARVSVIRQCKAKYVNEEERELDSFINIGTATSSVKIWNKLKNCYIMKKTHY